MTDLANLSDIALAGRPDAPLPGPVVRELVAWTERDIDALQQQLETAQREAEMEELRLSRHPAVHLIATANGSEAAPVWQAVDSAPTVVPHQEFTADQWDPVDGPSDPPATSATAHLPLTPPFQEATPRSLASRLPPGVAPRTTVVRRDTPASAPEMVSPGPAEEPAATGDSPVPATRRQIVRGRRGTWTDRLRGHWMMTAGMAIALLGLVLLKLG